MSIVTRWSRCCIAIGNGKTDSESNSNEKGHISHDDGLYFGRKNSGHGNIAATRMDDGLASTGSSLQNKQLAKIALGKELQLE